MNEQALWKLAKEGGMAALTVDKLAEETGQNVLSLSHLYPEPAFMVLVLIEDIHAQAMKVSPVSTQSFEDRLIERIMAHLDTSLEHREIIRHLWADIMTMPLVLLTLRPYLMKMVDHILCDCGLDKNDPWAPFRLRAYFTLFLYVLYVWIYDDSHQQEQTLVTLDKGLKQLQAFPW
ncbi:MAG: hypothetical protein FJX71_04960 [Alphaproteobacteria bacterium]|nr:hypothetical protein [Alphaproteobacteria bacterium]